MHCGPALVREVRGRAGMRGCLLLGSITRSASWPQSLATAAPLALQMAQRLQPDMKGMEVQSLVMSSVQSASLRAKLAHSAAFGSV